MSFNQRTKHTRRFGYGNPSMTYSLSCMMKKRHTNKYKRALVRKPCPQMVNGLTTADLGKADYLLACHQHADYVSALESCGLEVTVLEADNRYPDSVFIEDVALLTPACAIILNPGAPSRRGESLLAEPVLRSLFDPLEKIMPPGTVEGGDIMRAGDHYFIGLSSRTNSSGAQQLVDCLRSYDLTASIVSVKSYLHLKTAVSSLGNNVILAAGEFLHIDAFKDFQIIEVDARENYAANSIWVNGSVIMPAGFPNTKIAVEKVGYNVLEVDMSEFRKLDGGVSCLSLRF
jgi:dimethylargininase